MPRGRISAGQRERAFEQRQRARLVARYEALRLMAETGEGITPAANLGRGIGLLVGLEHEGLAARTGTRDRLGDPVFIITDAGRARLAAASAKGAL